jgi:hypothetical protein
MIDTLVSVKGVPNYTGVDIWSPSQSRRSDHGHQPPLGHRPPGRHPRHPGRNAAKTVLKVSEMREQPRDHTRIQPI